MYPKKCFTCSQQHIVWHVWLTRIQKIVVVYRYGSLNLTIQEPREEAYLYTINILWSRTRLLLVAGAMLFGIHCFDKYSSYEKKNKTAFLGLIQPVCRLLVKTYTCPKIGHSVAKNIPVPKLVILSQGYTCPNFGHSIAKIHTTVPKLVILMLRYIHLSQNWSFYLKKKKNL